MQSSDNASQFDFAALQGFYSEILQFAPGVEHLDRVGSQVKARFGNAHSLNCRSGSKRQEAVI